jgi:hypothetical protein
MNARLAQKPDSGASIKEITIARSDLRIRGDIKTILLTPYGKQYIIKELGDMYQVWLRMSSTPKGAIVKNARPL